MTHSSCEIMYVKGSEEVFVRFNCQFLVTEGGEAAIMIAKPKYVELIPRSFESDFGNLTVH